MSDVKKLAEVKRYNLDANLPPRAIENSFGEWARYSDIEHLPNTIAALLQEVEALRAQAAKVRQEALEEAANAARTLVQSGVTPDGIYHTIRALKQHTGEVSKGASTDAGWKLAMRVLQSDLYAQLDDEERAICDELIRRNPYMATARQRRATAVEDGETKP